VNIEEIDKWLDNEYGVSYTRLEKLHDFVVEQDMKHQEEKDKEIEKLQNQLQQKENIIKEIREFVEKWKYEDGDGSVYFDINTNPDDLLRILDKGE
jgi:uncharacterized protein YPO0396